MVEEKAKQQLRPTPNPEDLDRALAQLIGWTANLIGMVRKFPSGKDRDQTVFTTRKILKQLRALREGDTQALVQKEGRGKRRRPRRREDETLRSFDKTQDKRAQGERESKEERPRKEELKKEPEMKVREEKPVTPQALKEEDVGKAPVVAKQPPKAAQPEVAKPAKPKLKKKAARKRPSKAPIKPKRKPQKTQKEIPQKTQKKKEVVEKVGKETESAEEKIIFKKEAPKKSTS